MIAPIACLLTCTFIHLFTDIYWTPLWYQASNNIPERRAHLRPWECGGVPLGFFFFLKIVLPLRCRRSVNGHLMCVSVTLCVTHDINAATPRLVCALSHKYRLLMCHAVCIARRTCKGLFWTWELLWYWACHQPGYSRPHPGHLGVAMEKCVSSRCCGREGWAYTGARRRWNTLPPGWTVNSRGSSEEVIIFQLLAPPVVRVFQCSGENETQKERAGASVGACQHWGWQDCCKVKDKVRKLLAVVVKGIKLLSAASSSWNGHWFESWLPYCLSSWLLMSPGKVLEDGSSTWVTALMWERRIKILAPGFDLGQHWLLLQPFGKWISR